MKNILTFSILAASVVGVILLNGCASNRASLPTADHVDIERFMGRWYVVGYTPILVDKEAHNAIEHYRLDKNAKIQATYQFRDGAFDDELKTFTPVAWVANKETNAEWLIRFIWPLRSDYIILHVDSDYSETIIAHPSRKYGWIMTRSPEVAPEDYERLLLKLEVAGYDTAVIKRLPQDWAAEDKRIEQLKADDL